MMEACKRLLQTETYYEMHKAVSTARKAIHQRTAWRIEGTLREFPKFPPVNLWFSYPVHNVDDVGSLKDIAAEGEEST